MAKHPSAQYVVYTVSATFVCFTALRNPFKTIGLVINQIGCYLLHKSLSTLTLTMKAKFSLNLHVKLGFQTTYSMLSTSELIVELAGVPMQAFWYLVRIGAHLFGLSVSPFGLKYYK